MLLSSFPEDFSFASFFELNRLKPMLRTGMRNGILKNSKESIVYATLPKWLSEKISE
tara:strand:- start:121 stop:291 length:171 start_codon:yes stop_codon:yes gene_type:complete